MFTKCTLRDNIENLDKIYEILCTNKSKNFKQEFNAKYNSTINPYVNPILKGLSPNDFNLLSIIKHILRRPFYPLQIAGSEVHKGLRGGLYKIKNNKKIYIKK